MALARGNLGNVTVVGAGTSTAVYTVGSAKTAYVKAVLLHNLSQSDIQNARIHVVPNSGGSAGSATSTTQVARIGVGTDDTFFFEPAYPITLVANGDTIQVENEGSAATFALNVIVLGDKEA